MGLMEKIEAAQLKSDRPELRPGDTVEVAVRVIEGDKERQQKFRGEIINVRGAGVRKTFTVRKISDGIGVERTFPLHSPAVGEIKVLKHSKVRRAKLFYLRHKTGKAARLTEKKTVARERAPEGVAAWSPGAGSPARRRGSRVKPSPWPAWTRSAAAHWPDRSWPPRWCWMRGRGWDGVNDSKKLSPAAREAVYARVLQEARAFAWAVVGPRTIDALNIRRASLEAMRRAIVRLPLRARPGAGGRQRPRARTRAAASRSVISGDARLLSVAAASVVAKVVRDRIMERLDRVWPDYGFARHKGYGTPEHLAALGQLGPCPLHRFSFAPVRVQTPGRSSPSIGPRPPHRPRGATSWDWRRSAAARARRWPRPTSRLAGLEVTRRNVRLAGVEVDLVAREGRDAGGGRGEAAQPRGLRRRGRGGGRAQARAAAARGAGAAGRGGRTGARGRRGDGPHGRGADAAARPRRGPGA